MTRYPPDLIREIADLIEEGRGTRPTDDEAREALDNVAGFFTVLDQIERRLATEGRSPLAAPKSGAKTPPAGYNEDQIGDGRPGNGPRRSRRHAQTPPEHRPRPSG